MSNCWLFGSTSCPLAPVLTDVSKPTDRGHAAVHTHTPCATAGAALGSVSTHMQMARPVLPLLFQLLQCEFKAPHSHESNLRKDGLPWYVCTAQVPFALAASGACRHRDMYPGACDGGPTWDRIVALPVRMHVLTGLGWPHSNAQRSTCSSRVQLETHRSSSRTAVPANGGRRRTYMWRCDRVAGRPALMVMVRDAGKTEDAADGGARSRRIRRRR